MFLALLTNRLAKFFTLKNSDSKEFKCILIDFSNFHFLFTSTPQHNNRNSFWYALFCLMAGGCCSAHAQLSSFFKYKIKGCPLICKSQISFFSSGFSSGYYSRLFVKQTVKDIKEIKWTGLCVNTDIDRKNQKECRRKLHATEKHFHSSCWV